MRQNPWHCLRRDKCRKCGRSIASYLNEFFLLARMLHVALGVRNASRKECIMFAHCCLPGIRPYYSGTSRCRRRSRICSPSSAAATGAWHRRAPHNSRRHRVLVVRRSTIGGLSATACSCRRASSSTGKALPSAKLPLDDPQDSVFAGLVEFGHALIAERTKGGAGCYTN